jgi:hypothetical protein
MAIDVEKLLVSLEANLKQYEKELARANNLTVREMRKIEKSAQASMINIERHVGTLGASLRAGLAGAAAGAAAAFGVAIKSAISDAAKIGDVADKIGTTTDFLQELAYGAVQADLGFDELSDNLTRFSRLLGEAQNGQGDLLKLLEANGFSQAAVRAMDFADALRVVADLTRNARNEQDQLQVTAAAFGGRAGGAMIEFLRTGSEGLRQFGQDATEAGAKIDEALIKKAQELDDRWAALMQSLRMKTQSAVLSITDLLSSIKIEGDDAPSVGPGRSAPARGYSAAGRKTPDRGVGAVGFSFTPRLPAVQTAIPDEAADRDAERRAEEARRERERAAAEALRQRQAELKAIEDVISALEFENEQLGRNELQQQIATQQRQAGVTATSEQGKAIAALVTENYNLAQAQEYQKEAQQAQLDAAQEATEKFVEQQEEMQRAWQQLGEIGFDAFLRITQGGEKASAVVRDIASQLATAALQASLLGSGPLASLFGGGKGGGLFGQLLGSFGSPGGNVSAGIYHQGGLVGGGGPSRMVPAAAFEGAPRFHRGGGYIGPGERPAILQPGEVVLPRNMRLNAGGGSQKIEIYDQRKNAPEIERRTNSQGNPQLFIKDAVNGVISSGQADGAMGGRYAVKPARMIR